MNIKIFIPTDQRVGDFDALLQAATKTKALAPFDQLLVDFVIDFAKSILLDNHARTYPELIVLANYFKNSNLLRLKSELVSSNYIARGFVFHLAPSNVDSIFLYSSLLSLLCGNINFVRISREVGPQVFYVMDKINSLIGQKHSHIRERFFVISYDHDDAITTRISEFCHMRVVWGGDVTVRKIRSLPLRPTALELCFPDRFSAAMFDSQAILAASELEITGIASRFFYDSIWFSQQACSSPRLIAWIGRQEDIIEARIKFWAAFETQLSDKTYENTAGMVMDRFVSACLVSADPIHRETSSLKFPTRILVENTTIADIKDYHCGNGLFYEQFFDSVSNFLETISDREQTLSVFGFDHDYIKNCLRDLPLRSIDRITNIGNALDFSHIWDGYNLLQMFTRQISLRL